MSRKSKWLRLAGLLFSGIAVVALGTYRLFFPKLSGTPFAYILVAVAVLGLFFSYKIIFRSRARDGNTNFNKPDDPKRAHAKRIREIGIIFLAAAILITLLSVVLASQNVVLPTTVIASVDLIVGGIGFALIMISAF